MEDRREPFLEREGSEAFPGRRQGPFAEAFPGRRQGPFPEGAAKNNQIPNQVNMITQGKLNFTNDRYCFRCTMPCYCYTN